MKVIRQLYLLFIILCFAAGSPVVRAQAVYTLYPAPAATVDAAPEGYKAVYVSHFGRHGSRYLIKREERAANKILSKAELPQAVRDAVTDIRNINIGHEGELSEKGAAEQFGIGERMAERLPELFGSGNAKIRARASIAGRCKASMRNFLDGMHSVAPEVKEKTSASVFTYRKFSRGVGHGRYKSRHPELLALAHYAWNAECLGISKMQIVKYLTREEHNAMLDELDSAFCHSLMPSSKEEALCAKALLEDITGRADDALSGKRGYVADLRFGHDSAFVPLGCLMGLKGFDKNTRIGNIVPMSANIQLVFYKADADPSDILVKILHNEQVTSIPELSPTLTKNSGLYYSWPELKAYFLSR